MQQRRSGDGGRHCGNAWSGLKNWSQKVGIERKSNKLSKKSYMKVGVKKLLRAGMVPARTWGAEGGSMARTSSSSLAKDRENWTEKHRNVARKIFVEGGWTQQRLCDIGWSDVSQCQACRNGTQ